MLRNFVVDRDGVGHGKVFVPDYAGIAIYVVMAAILLWRPEGLFKS